MELINIIQASIILILFSVLIAVLKLSRVVRLEKRIDKYTITSIKNDNISFFDDLVIIGYEYRRHLSKKLSKSKVLIDYSKKYDKYVDKNKIIPEIGMDYISTKFILAFFFLLITIVSSAFWNRLPTSYEISLSTLIGFFIPDIILMSKDKIINKNIENDLLKAITIMNNAFKSGNSIMQAVQITSNEIDGPLKDEFRKMYIDLTYGLSVDVVFKRFSKRVDNEEIKYMTTSLTILNKTGGNIAKVFSSIERSFFRRRKLNQEMKSLTGSASFMFKILVIIPFFIAGIIILINPTYFVPLFTTPLGLSILVIIIVIYVIYVVLINKIMKVEGLR